MINAPARETSPAVISRKLCARFSWSADGTPSVALRALPPRLLLIPAALELVGLTVLPARNAENGARRPAAFIADGYIFTHTWSRGASHSAGPHLRGGSHFDWRCWLTKPTRLVQHREPGMKSRRRQEHTERRWAGSPWLVLTLKL